MCAPKALPTHSFPHISKLILQYSKKQRRKCNSKKVEKSNVFSCKSRLEVKTRRLLKSVRKIKNAANGLSFLIKALTCYTAIFWFSDILLALFPKAIKSI